MFENVTYIRILYSVLILWNITSNVYTTAIFVIVGLQTVFPAQSVGMFMICLHTKFCIFQCLVS